MKRFGNFVKATLLGGLFVLLPVVLIYLILDEMLELAVVLATPIADLFPVGVFDKLTSPSFVAILLIIGTSLIIGLLMLAGPGRALGHLIERNVLNRVPGYSVIRTLIRSMGSMDDTETFKPALLSGEDGTWEMVYLIERLDDGRVVVMLPWALTPMSGNVKIVNPDLIEPLNTSLADMTKVLGHWGAGTRELIASTEAPKSD